MEDEPTPLADDLATGTEGFGEHPKHVTDGKGSRRTVTGFTVAVLFMLALAIFLFKSGKTVVVSGTSMIPTLKDGQRLYVSHAYWLVGPIRRKDIVVVRDYPTGYFIKRVYALAGDPVEPVYVPKDHRLSTPYIVPPDSLYLLGDNRARSEDSRSFGAVNKREVIGKVVVFR